MQYIAGFFIILSVLTGTFGLWTKIQLQQAEAEIQVLIIEKDAAVASQVAAEEAQAFQAIQVQEFQVRNAQLQADAVASRKQVEYTRDLFNDHDFAKLMAAKPGLITNRMQRATDAVLADLRAVTE
jgi:hypothetical protein